MKVFRKLSAPIPLKDPLRFPSLKRDEDESDLVFDFVPHHEVPDTRWEQFKNDIIKELQWKQFHGGPGYYEDVNLNVGKNYIPRSSPQAIQELRLFR